ncbi:leukocyte elastase inhibitor A-like isoform X2 [Lytechinus variegatus]|uniref:leukocyte elastase inhibitor A-like isoform X2 n=1 Tax=Lytechinus variegatus TaxID=7654 RepID=UPI001BB1AE00|nr:leukocyte elastase inhibitor A-like isoform X2 [Lytechinus variegatus]
MHAIMPTGYGTVYGLKIRQMEYFRKPPASEQLLQLSGANNAFAIYLYQTLRDERGGRNLFFSPLSISTALAMTQLGARGDTASQIANVFRFNQADLRQLHGTFKELNSLLYKPDSGYKLHAANKLYGKSGYNFVRSFLEGTASYYGAAIEAVDDFADPTTTKSINDWVSKQTEGKIKDLIAPGVLDALTRLVLVNAIYFNGAWESKFLPGNTSQDSFKVLDERRIVQMNVMFQMGKFNLAKDKSNDCLVLELPYRGQSLSLLIALPNKDDGLDKLESNLSTKTFQSWDKGLQSTLVHVMLPKFKLEAEFQLADTLKVMGMPDAFDKDRANFEGIAGDKDLYISAVIHKAFVDVNEEGSEAAAATAVMVMLGCSMPAKPKKPILFRADHPFLFIIRHRLTKSVIFMGRMMDPS